MHDPFHDAFVYTSRRHQLGSFPIRPPEQSFPILVNEGDRGQIYAHGVDLLSVYGGAPAEFQLLHPGPGELPFQLEVHHADFYSHVNFQHTEFFKPLSFFSRPPSSRRRRFSRMTGSTSSPHCTQRFAKKLRWPLSSKKSKHCSTTISPPHREHCAVPTSSFHSATFASFKSSAGNPTAVTIDASPSTFRQSESCPDSIQRLLVRYMEHD